MFCAHVFFVFVGLALLYGEMNELHGRYALMLLAITFTGLMLVALREVRRKQKIAALRRQWSRCDQSPALLLRLQKAGRKLRQQP